MPRHKLPPSLVMRTIALIKRNPIASIASLVGILAGIPGAVAGYSYGIEPGLPALHYYVRGEIYGHTSPLLQRVIELQLAQNDIRRERLLDEAAKREIELQSSQAKQLPQYRALVQQRVDRVKEELKTIDEQDKSLFNEKKPK